MTSKKNNKNNTVIVDDNIRQTSIQIIQEYVNDEQLSKNIEQEIYNFSLKNFEGQFFLKKIFFWSENPPLFNSLKNFEEKKNNLMKFSCTFQGIFSSV